MKPESHEGGYDGIPNPRLVDRRSWRDWSESQNAALDQLAADICNGGIELENVTHCLCGGTSFKSISTVDRFSINSPTKLCVACGLVLTSPRIAPSSVKRYYEEYYPRLLSSDCDADKLQHLYSESQGSKVLSYVGNFLEDKKVLKILDFGAGRGDVGVFIRDELKRKGIEVELLAVESNTQSKEYLRQRAVAITDEKDFFEARHGKFDLIIFSHILEHIHDFVGLLRKTRRLLANQGCVYIEVPGVFSIHKRANYLFSYTGYSIHAHLYNFCLASLSFHVFRSGCEIVQGNEDIQLIVKKGAARWPHYLSWRRAYGNFRRRAAESVNYLIGYLSVLEDVSSALVAGEQLETENTTLKKKLRQSEAVLKDSEIILNSQLARLGGSTPEVHSLFEGKNIYQRMPMKSWLVEVFSARTFLSDPGKVPFALYYFLPGMRVLKNGFIQLDKLESEGFVYSFGSETRTFSIKPGPGVVQIHYQLGEFERVVMEETKLSVRLVKGINRISLKAKLPDGKTRTGYVSLIKPAASD